MDAKGSESELVCIADEVPFEIPKNWGWVQLENGCRAIVDCPHSTPQYLEAETGYVAIDTNCIDDDWHLTGTRNLSKESYEIRVGRYVPQVGDLIFTREGSIGRSLIINRNQVCLGQRVMLMSTFQDVLMNTYCQLVLSSPYAWTLYKAAHVGTGAKHINVAMVKALLVPLPPLAEQRRIVAKVEELMPLVEEYGALEDERERLDSSLPDALRKSILQEAVEGRLVPQDPADEPASALLVRIRDERRKMVADGKLRPPKGGESVIFAGSDGRRYEKRVDAKGRESEPVCIEDEIPFDVPEGWEWARLGALVDMQAGKNIAASKIAGVKDADHPYPCFGGNGVRGFVSRPNRRGWFPIIGRQGARCGCINYAKGDFYATEHAVVVTCSGDVSVKWCGMMLEALNLNQYATATAQPGLAVSKIAQLLVPLPPNAEQRRIVERVQELFDTID